MASHIVSITGLQNLINLQEFNADYNALQTLDLSGLTNLVNVDVSDCDELGSTGIKSINLTGCTSLIELRLDDNDFSAGFPDLSSCTALEWIDFDQCHLVGSINVSNLPALKGFDFNGNTELTNVVISPAQSLGAGRTLNLYNCSLPQDNIDTMLSILASGSVTNGEIYLFSEESINSVPSEDVGVPAIRELLNRDWYVDTNPFSTPFNVTPLRSNSSDVCMDLANGDINANGAYAYSANPIQAGTKIYQDSYLRSPIADGWIGAEGTGMAQEIINGEGLIADAVGCA